MSAAPEKGVAARLFGNAYLVLGGRKPVLVRQSSDGRAITGHVPPLAIATLRWLFAAAILYPFVRHQLAKDWPLIRRHFGVIVYLALVGGALFGALQFVALQLTAALNVSVMNSLAPVFIALLRGRDVPRSPDGRQFAGNRNS